MRNFRCSKILEDILFNNMNYAYREQNKFNRRFNKYKINLKLSIDSYLFDDSNKIEENMNLVIEYVKTEWEQRKLKRIMNAGNVKKRGRL